MKMLRTFTLLVTLAASAALPAAPDSTQSVPDRLDLPTALRFALENNFTIRQARERLNQAEGALMTARAGLLPHASVDSSYSRTSRQITTDVQDDELWSASAGVTQTVYAGGSVAAGARAARASRDAAQYELQATINQIVAGVRIGFFSVLRAQETIAVREQSLGLLEEELKNARNRYEAGAGAQFDVLRAEVALANGRPPLITARNDLKIAIEELRELLGFTNREGTNLDKVPDFVGELSISQEQFSLADVLEASRRDRPELQALAKGINIAQSGVTIARAGYLPTVGVSAGWEIVGNRARYHSMTGHSNYDGWYLGAQSSWAVFDGRATAGRVRSAKSQLNQARLSLQQQELAIDVDVRRAFATWQEAVELVTASGKVVEQATEALRLSRARFDVGAATQLDVLQAQVALTEAGNNKVQALYAYNAALAQLRLAIGQRDPELPGATVR
ncbi:MAG TPA: TolC family protein [Opitutaceae bacterium]|nr:TolC family protein [Opitutaceae bacterium]